MALDYLPFIRGSIVSRTKVSKNRFKIFVDYQMLTISQFSGRGKGNVAQNKENFTGGTEGKLCYMKRGL